MTAKRLLASYTALTALYAAWSWILVTPGLRFSAHPLYLQAQNWLQDSFYANRPLIAGVYLVLVIALSVNYLLLTEKLRFTGIKSLLLLTLAASAPLLFSYNALSADVFNYIFNAKMVAVYRDNPHVHTASDYPGDDWTRFMHNVHTTAPYGYGWTLVSLVPYSLGLSKFTLTWLSFRASNLILLLATLALLVAIQRRLEPNRDPAAIWGLALNPLLLIEILGNIHNDLWMMLPAVWALYLVADSHKRQSASTIVLSLLLLAVSLSIKYATLALVPAWLYLVAAGRALPGRLRLPFKWQTALSRFFSWVRRYFFDLCALAMFLPLLTGRAQRFHPWYLTWCLVFWPLTRAPLTRTSLLILSVSSLLRYLPYLWANGYSPTLLWQQQLISLLPVALYWLGLAGRRAWRQIAS